MAQALSAVYVHAVFSTKERRPLLRDVEMRIRLHEYLGGISKELDCPPVRVGGVEDHVHLLCRFGRTISQADWIKELKRVSSVWMKEQNPKNVFGKTFQWQGGYADFSVSVSNLEKVTEYIAKQQEHHRTMNFQDELRTLLKKHRVEWDEEYLWD